MRRLNLSFQLSSRTPVYPGAPDVKISAHRQMKDGFSYNSYKIEAFNHSSTHIDAPAHVFLEGRPLNSFGLDDLTFNFPALIDVATENAELIQPEQLTRVSALSPKTDLLFLRTRHSQYRQSDPARFIENGPGLSLRAVNFLLKSLKNLRAVGVDFISVTSVQHLEEGVLAHRALLGAHPPVLIVEDLNLLQDISNLTKVSVIPVFIEGVDSSWCTVIAECREL
jgi:arylformamidase